MKIKTQNPSETQQFARKFARELKAGDVLALFGDLGSGKTTFVKGLAKGLGVKNKVVSPTFVFMRQYPIKLKKVDCTFYHIDLYRGQTESDFTALGLGEIFANDSLVVLEWADRIKNQLPKKRINIVFETVDDSTRRIEIKRN